MNPKALFIKGPIPFEWLMSANQISRSTGLIGIGLWFYVGLNKKYQFKIDGKLDKLTGISRQTRQMALMRLHKAGLIELTKYPGAYPQVKVIPIRGGVSEKLLDTPLIPLSPIFVTRTPNFRAISTLGELNEN